MPNPFKRQKPTEADLPKFEHMQRIIGGDKVVLNQMLTITRKALEKSMDDFRQAIIDDNDDAHAEFAALMGLVGTLSATSIGLVRVMESILDRQPGL